MSVYFSYSNLALSEARERAGRSQRHSVHCVQGFNTFLPEGYKIDLHQLEEMDRQHREREAREAAAAAGQNAGQGARGPAPGQPLPGAGGQGGPPVS